MAGFWDDVVGFVGNLAKVSEAAEGVTGSLADNSENIARGQAAYWNERYERQDNVLDLKNQELQMQLDRFTTYRGDNVQFYWAAAIGIGFGLVLLK